MKKTLRVISKKKKNRDCLTKIFEIKDCKIIYESGNDEEKELKNIKVSLTKQ